MTVILLIVGALPFVVGGIQNWCMLHTQLQIPYGLTGFLFLLLWGCLGFFLHPGGKRTARTVICMNLIAALDLLLVGIEELVLHKYLIGPVGAWSQLFYLPVINISARLTLWSRSLFPAYAVSFTLMAAAAFAGAKLRENIQK